LKNSSKSSKKANVYSKKTIYVKSTTSGNDGTASISTKELKSEGTITAKNTEASVASTKFISESSPQTTETPSLTISTAMQISGGNRDFYIEYYFSLRLANLKLDLLFFRKNKIYFLDCLSNRWIKLNL